MNKARCTTVSIYYAPLQLIQDTHNRMNFPMVCRSRSCATSKSSIKDSNVDDFNPCIQLGFIP